MIQRLLLRLIEERCAGARCIVNRLSVLQVVELRPDLAGQHWCLRRCASSYSCSCFVKHLALGVLRYALEQVDGDFV